jgi:Fic family protein
VESVTASSAIEGVIVDDARVPKLVSGTESRFRNRSEEEFAGYAEALDYLYLIPSGPLSTGLVCHLHRLLFSHTVGHGGLFKLDDNVVTDSHPDGTRSIRFSPVSARETPFFMDELIVRTEATLAASTHHPLLVAAAFILDFSCIHPFADGNGRIARLLTTYLIQRAGYGVGRYISLEQLIFDARDEYYKSLLGSTSGWFDDGHHSLWPWAEFLLEQLAESYRLFELRIGDGMSGATKQVRVRTYVLTQAPDRFSKADLRRALPGVGDNTLRLVLQALRDEGLIHSDGVGRNATWRRG